MQQSLNTAGKRFVSNKYVPYIDSTWYDRMCCCSNYSKQVFVANNLKVGDGNNENVILNYSLPTSLLFENDLCLTCTFKA